MQTFPLRLRASVCFLLSILFVVIGFCYGKQSRVEVVGIGECADCKQYNVKSSHAFSGLSVTIDCKLENGHFKTRGAGRLDRRGNFKVSLPSEIVKDGEVKEECYAQLHSATAAPCPAHDGLDHSNIVIKSNNGHTDTIGPAGKLKFSSVTCASALFWPSSNFPPLPKLPPLPPHPFFKHFGHPFPFPPKVLPPLAPIYKKPCPPISLPPPVPVYKPPPSPVKKPCPPNPVPPSVPIYKPPPSPVKKPSTPKSLPPPVPIYKPPPSPIKKPCPPPIPIYKPPPIPKILPPFPKFPPFKKKPCPPLPKLPPFPNFPPKYFPHPKYGKWPPLPPFSPHP